MKGTKTAFPYTLWMVIFIIVPLILVAGFALTGQVTAEGGADGETVTVITLENISRVGQFAPVLLRSVHLAAVATVICLVICYPIAYIISRGGSIHKRTLLMLIILPMWMNFLLRTYAWMTLLENNGLINRFFGLFGIGPFSMINTGGAVILGMVYNFMPFMILPLYAVMTKIDVTTLEAARDLGADGMGVFTKVILPMSVPGIKTGITMVFVPAVSTFIISRMLGGGGFLLIGDLIDLQFLGNAYNPHLGAAISLFLMVIILLCMSIFNQFGSEEEMEGALL
ncbi:MAG: ABC transporter permease [Oscillospiraceae bacterium]|nr:ABC transporter permease [Oscillospiraceae bacterium]